jgi:uncharacterized protein (TIGR00661 family)
MRLIQRRIDVSAARMSKRILFLVNGLGLGNSTRCHAVIQHLIGQGASVSVVTSGNGAWYFQNQSGLAAVYEIEPLYYGVGGESLSVRKTLTSALDLIKIARRNAKLTEGFVSAAQPDVVVADSVYSVLGIRKRGIPLLAINNADIVHQSYRRFANPPSSIRAQFYCIEEMDYLFHRMVPNLVLSPCLDPNQASADRKFLRIGPIVRHGIRQSEEAGGAPRVLVMLSGSQFGSPVSLNPQRHDYHIDVVGRDPLSSQITSEKIVFHGKTLDNEKLIRNADLLVVNGGFSAVSEAFVLQKPMIVIPVPNHAEQWVNATTIKNLKVGVMADDAGLEDAICSVFPRIGELKATYANLPAAKDGALQAADEILRRAN